MEQVETSVEQVETSLEQVETSAELKKCGDKEPTNAESENKSKSRFLVIYSIF